MRMEVEIEKTVAKATKEEVKVIETMDHSEHQLSHWIEVEAEKTVSEAVTTDLEAVTIGLGVVIEDLEVKEKQNHNLSLKLTR